MSSEALIIFGFMGDLSKRKLLPALYTLERLDKLNPGLKIVGISRREVADDQSTYEELYSHIKTIEDECDEAALKRLVERVTIIKADAGSVEGAEDLHEQIEDILGKSCGMKYFYFAIPPQFLITIIQNLVAAKVHTCGGNDTSRLLIEKPFGHDTASAERLSHIIRDHFGQASIYLIDHYLAKDTVQNLLYFRFHNPMLKPLWESRSVKAIQITAIESLDIQDRGSFYEQTGALRDMLQSHLMQLLALTTMEEPDAMSADSIRANRLELLKSVKLAGSVSDSSIRGQYIGYKDEVDNPDSHTETFAAVKLKINNERWKDTPIYLRTGKAMDEKVGEVNIIFDSDGDEHEQNILTFRIQPHEGIAIRMIVKKPGLSNETEAVTFDYCYASSDSPLSAGYDRILHDALTGDQTHFPSDNEIMSNWKLYQPILDAWQNSGEGLHTYEKGSHNLTEAEEFISRDDLEWIAHAAWVCSVVRPQN